MAVPKGVDPQRRRRVVEMLDDERLADGRPARPIDSLCVEVPKSVAFEQQVQQASIRRPPARTFRRVLRRRLPDQYPFAFPRRVPGRTGAIHVCRCELNASQRPSGEMSARPMLNVGSLTRSASVPSTTSIARIRRDGPGPVERQDPSIVREPSRATRLADLPGRAARGRHDKSSGAVWNQARCTRPGPIVGDHRIESDRAVRSQGAAPDPSE